MLLADYRAEIPAGGGARSHPLVGFLLWLSSKFPRQGVLARLVSPVLLRGRRYARRTSRGFRMVWRASNIELVPYMLTSGGWDEAVANKVASTLPLDGVFYDIGSNAGYISMVAASAAPQAAVIAFEPIPTLAADVASAARENGFENVTAYNVALADEDGAADAPTSVAALSS